jgi:cell wall assembly regulator SMI1
VPDERLISAWSAFRAALSACAPVSLEFVVAPADDQFALRRELGLAYPEVAQTWFSLHDGAGFDFRGGMILPGNLALSQQRAIEDTKMSRAIWADIDPGQTEDTSGHLHIAGEVVGTWLPDYLMVGTDGCGGGYFLDLRPGPLHGCVRSWDNVDSDRSELVAPNLAALIESLAASLATGANFTYWKPAFADGWLDWEIDPAFL